MTEVQRSQWLLSMPSYAVVNEAMQNLTDVGYHTNNQAVSQGNGRQEMFTPPRHGTGSHLWCVQGPVFAHHLF